MIGQSGKPQTIIIPTGSLGDISEIRKKMLEKTLESELDDYFAIVPKELFEEAQEQVFEELEYDECTEDQCIKMIQELLQVENSFKMDLLSEDGDTQISITWNDQDQKRVEEDYCEGCKTKGLRLMIGGLVKKLVGEKEIKPIGVERPVVVVERNEREVLYGRGISLVGYFISEEMEWGWYSSGDGGFDWRYTGEIKNGLPHGQGTFTLPDGRKYVGQFKDGRINGQGTFTYFNTKYVGSWYNWKWWNGRLFDENRNIIYTLLNGERQ